MKMKMTQGQWDWIFSYVFLAMVLSIMMGVLWLVDELKTPELLALAFWAHHQAFTWDRPFPRRP